MAKFEFKHSVPPQFIGTIEFDGEVEGFYFTIRNEEQYESINVNFNDIDDLIEALEAIKEANANNAPVL